MVQDWRGIISSTLFTAIILLSLLVPASTWATIDSKNLYTDISDIRSDFAEKGVKLNARSISDIFGNTTGGAGKGGAYAGLLTFGTDVDLEKSLGWEGGSFNSTWIWIYGDNLTTKYIGNSMFIVGIAASPAFRCYQMWLDQKLFDKSFSVRAGLLAINIEFGLSQTAFFFINNTFSMPALFICNFPNGGATYPMATPGIRLAFNPYPWMTLRSVFSQANPFPQTDNPNNFNWNFGPAGGLGCMTEIETTWNQKSESKGLAGMAKVGYWINNGYSLGNPTPGHFNYGAPTQNEYGTGFEALIDQQLTDPCPMIKSAEPSKNKPGSKEGLSGFVRGGFSPLQWSTTSLYIDGGLVYTGILPERKKDKVGIAFAYAQMSPDSRSLASAAGLPGPSFESIAELSYSWNISSSCSLQPDLEYVIHPNGTQQFGNALVIGIRAVINF
jgi:porin